MPDLATPPDPRDVIGREITSGAILDPPADTGSSLTVAIEGKMVSIERWDSRGGTIPAAGDPALVATDPDGEPWLVAWWPLNGDGLPSSVASSSTLTLTTTPTDIAGATYTLPMAGTYLITAVFDLVVTTAGVGVVVGTLVVDGVTQPGAALAGNELSRGTVAQQWVVTTSGVNKVAKLQGGKFAGTGVASIGPGNTTMTVVKVA